MGKTWIYSNVYRVVVVASRKMGQVLDVEVLSKHCTTCSHRQCKDRDIRIGGKNIKHIVLLIMKNHLQPRRVLCSTANLGTINQ